MLAGQSDPWRSIRNDGKLSLKWLCNQWEKIYILPPLKSSYNDTVKNTFFWHEAEHTYTRSCHVEQSGVATHPETQSKDCSRQHSHKLRRWNKSVYRQADQARPITSHLQAAHTQSFQVYGLLRKTKQQLAFQSQSRFKGFGKQYKSYKLSAATHHTALVFQMTVNLTIQPWLFEEKVL